MPLYDVTLGSGGACRDSVRVRVTAADVTAAIERGELESDSRSSREWLAIQRAVRRRWGAQAHWSAEHGTQRSRGQVTRPAREPGVLTCLTPTIRVDVELVSARRRSS